MIGSKYTLSEALERPRTFERRHLGELLFHTGVITSHQLKQAMDEQSAQEFKEPLGRILKRLNFASDNDIRNALSCCLEIPYIQLEGFDLEIPLLKLIPPEFARSHCLIPLMNHKDRLVIAMEDPTDTDTLQMLNFITGHVIEPVLASAEDIEYAISKHYLGSDETDILKELPSETKSSYWEEQQARKMASDKPIVKLVHNLIVDAISRKASDIHIRPKLKEVDVLLRVDGSLTPIKTMDKQLLAGLVARIKIIGGMNIAEHRLPQDGRSKIKHKGSDVDLRISVMPTIHGESVVIRVLDTSTSLKQIEDIGFSAKDAQLFRDLVGRSSGLLLVTGPTGSGKTTTLYAALQAIKKNEINIITVEDPVEYHVDDILQIQVNKQIGYTFARALRNILRHDPDSIMIGEIRDEETAKIAVESSLTGHLVLSTLHTNSAASTITRLLEIGIQPYLLNSTLLAVLAQRLVKKNCTHCLVVEDVSDSMRHDLGIENNEIFYKGAGCEKCHGSGYAGRIAVYELLEVTAKIRDMIQPKVNASDIEATACSQGMIPLTSHALSMAREKLTSIEEVYRVRLL